MSGIEEHIGDFPKSIGDFWWKVFKFELYKKYDVLNAEMVANNAVKGLSLCIQDGMTKGASRE